tara:strand:- start:11618 stop:11989 length:372 start_codon:yes stop_codon:yes gene_type:complete
MEEAHPMRRIFVHRQELGPNPADSQQDVLDLEGTLVQDRPQPIAHDADLTLRRDGHASVKLLFHDLLQGRGRSNQERVTTSKGRFEFVEDLHQVSIDSDPIADVQHRETSATIHRVLLRLDLR